MKKIKLVNGIQNDERNHRIWSKIREEILSRGDSGAETWKGEESVTDRSGGEHSRPTGQPKRRFWCRKRLGTARARKEGHSCWGTSLEAGEQRMIQQAGPGRCCRGCPWDDQTQEGRLGCRGEGREGVVHLDITSKSHTEPQEMFSKETEVSITYVPGPDLGCEDTRGGHSQSPPSTIKTDRQARLRTQHGKATSSQGLSLRCGIGPPMLAAKWRKSVTHHSCYTYTDWDPDPKSLRQMSRLTTKGNSPVWKRSRIFHQH